MFAYSIENDAINNNDELSDMLYHTEMESITVQSEKYGYTIAFNTKDQQFELLKTLTNDHLALPDEFRELQPDVPTPDDSESGAETPSPDAPTNPEEPVEPNPGDDESDDENDVVQPIITVNSNYIESSDKLNYVDGELIVSNTIVFDDSGYEKAKKRNIETIALNQLFTIENGNSISYGIDIIQTITYANYDYEIFEYDSINQTLKFNFIGTYTITVRVDNVEISIVVRVINDDIKRADLYNQNVTKSQINKGENQLYYLDFKVFDFIVIDDYFSQDGAFEKNNFTNENLTKENAKLLLEDKRLYITYNKEALTLAEDGINSYFTIDNITDLCSSFQIDCHYQGYNGEWISQTYQFSLSPSGPFIEATISVVN